MRTCSTTVSSLGMAGRVVSSGAPLSFSMSRMPSSSCMQQATESSVSFPCYQILALIMHTCKCIVQSEASMRALWILSMISCLPGKHGMAVFLKLWNQVCSQNYQNYSKRGAIMFQFTWRAYSSWSGIRSKAMSDTSLPLSGATSTVLPHALQVCMHVCSCVCVCVCVHVCRNMHTFIDMGA